MNPSSAAAVETRKLLWLALSLTPGLGHTRQRRLLEHCGDVEAIFHASLTELEAAGMPPATAQAIANGRSLAEAELERDRARIVGAEIVALGEEHYPETLGQIYDPPPVLYVRGDPTVLQRAGLAVIGTRHPSPYGLGMAERLSCDLAAHGLVIFSGLARGIDTASHRGALAGKGRTVGVMGTGIDLIYPRENLKIAEQIMAQGGAVISEFPVGTHAAPQNFPIRNRIISGLAWGVLVIEGGEYSGTRITARCALEQNREVFAVPGNVTSKNSWTPNTLIKQGAKLTATWEDVWEELPAQVRLQLEPPLAPASECPQGASLFAEGLSVPERRVFALLKADTPVHIDQVIEALDPDVSSSEIFAALFELELTGKIRQMPGKYFVKTF